MVTPEDALKHPRWKMGNKVTIDSATLMNKGLEIIEAHWLFGLPSENIKVVIHPQCIIHSMVEFIDGTVFAQLSQPDMKGPIAYALSCPERLNDTVEPLNFAKIGKLTFSDSDEERFPAIRLAYKALEAGGLMPSVMNAANEVAVQKFHERVIRFPSIPAVTEKVMERFQNDRSVNLENILWADRWARDESEKVIEEFI
jgi:1-deoxy-D-xylulose-5-phosphate reductoisomerase